MKDIKTKPATFSRAFPVRNRLSGFSLIELMIAMALFLVIGGTVVSLVRMHMPLFNTTQNQAQINISLRNAVAQLQMEAVNAGSGYTPLNPMPASPVGLTIGTKTNNTCKTTGTYVAACFDSLTLISADGSVPPLTPSKDTLGTVQLDTNVSGTLYLTWPGNPAIPTAANYTSWASQFRAGDEVVLVTGGTDFINSQPAMTLLTLTANGASTGNFVQLSYTTTTTSAGVCPGRGAAVSGIPASATKDTLGIYDPTVATVPPECSRFTNIFNPGIDYAIRLTAVTYTVDLLDPTNPKLVRTYTIPPVAPSVTPTVVRDEIAEQIVGFNVDAWSTKLAAGGSTGGYSTNSNSGSYSRDWASLHSIKVQLVARTTPNSDNSVAFKNSYDQGSYQVQGVSVVINPRNLNTN